MSEAYFDVLAYTKILTGAGFSREQADAMAEAQQIASKATVTKSELEAKQLATKGDIANVRLEIERLRADMRVEIEKTRISMIRWLVGTALVLGGTLIALIFGLWTMLPRAAAMAPALG